MKKTCILVTLLCLFSICSYSQKRSQSITKRNIPAIISKEATIVLNFLDLPGRANEKSSWEVSYELRIIDRKSSIEAAKAGKLKQMSIQEEKVGDFIAKGSFRKENISQATNRKVVLKIPLDEKIREKLKNAQKLRQSFLFYGLAIVFDGKLKKNIFVPLSWVWQYEVYPDAKFGMDFKIEQDTSEGGYSYSRTTFLPEKLPKGYFVTSSPSN